MPLLILERFMTTDKTFSLDGAVSKVPGKTSRGLWTNTTVILLPTDSSCVNLGGNEK